MKPIEFKEQNRTFAKDQPEYEPLPAHATEDGIVITCWKLTRRERWRVFLSGLMWWGVATQKAPLQPQIPYVTNPLIPMDKAVQK